MKMMTLDDLYLDQLQDMHSCERQLVKALPKMAKAVDHAALKSAFTKHLEVTKSQLERLDGILQDLGKTAGRKVCEATVGLVKEGAEIIEADADPQVRDVGLICAAQKIEHYEIASYGCLRTYATLLGRKRDVAVLEKTLNEEKSADEALTALAMDTVNADAVS